MTVAEDMHFFMDSDDHLAITDALQLAVESLQKNPAKLVISGINRRIL